MDAEQLADSRQKVDRQQIERVHQHDPHERGERKRRDIGNVALDDRAGLLVDELHQRLDRADKAARHARMHPPGGAIHEEGGENGHQHRIKHRVDVDDGEIDDVLLRATGRVQVRQMVDDVLGWGGSGRACHVVSARVVPPCCRRVTEPSWVAWVRLVRCAPGSFRPAPHHQERCLERSDQADEHG